MWPHLGHFEFLDKILQLKNGFSLILQFKQIKSSDKFLNNKQSNTATKN